ncbi:TetR-like C-terminal domain-containing protein [Catenuloplanes atrovinosus]|uniref:AcrR family transcriptional regulator n=1 Tax=Catenuloplanes atrovinosus TaxID=137266 RepID=A0AAE3YJL7_9ACTN|nr:TetR-like C-terminal domain-containing protein [Catenuloplanes atrovinosus]MDR7274102.1 AcrR family transcriptional regulator [Catenuloplanes atrovinosus]
MTLTAPDAPRPPEPRAPGRPRSSRADEAIIEATLDLLAEGSSIEALAIEAIAARAGVGKATIYRRWAGKDALLRDALARLKRPPADPDTGDVREDLLILARSIGKNKDPRAEKIMPCLVPEAMRSAEQYTTYQQIVEPRRAVTREILRRGIARGELRADLDVEVVLTALTGPILIQRMLRWNPRLDEERFPEQVVDLVMKAITA